MDFIFEHREEAALAEFMVVFWPFYDSPLRVTSHASGWRHLDEIFQLCQKLVIFRCDHGSLWQGR